MADALWPIIQITQINDLIDLVGLTFPKA